LKTEPNFRKGSGGRALDSLIVAQVGGEGWRAGKASVLFSAIYPNLIVFLAENLKRTIRFPNWNSMWQIIGQSVWTIGLNGRF
jgi:hypothetical protein